MCGICGVAGVDPERPPLATPQLRAMMDVVAHRGPDDEGIHIAPGVALGFRRLSIIDLATGAQPLANEDGGVTTIFNGEIYNFRELRADLAARGHRFETSGDAETIVHLYEELGARFPERLRGMFAIAIWDAERNRLVLARDRLGVKPLYVAAGPHGVAFASEVKSLVAGGVVRPALDPVAAELFLAWGFVPGPRTLFAGVSKLPPATATVYERGRLVEELRYWTPPEPRPDQGKRDFSTDQAELMELLRRSVRDRMVSDVPLGVMLSGGLDSSLIAALMTEASSAPVKTFSIGFAEDSAANELGDARHVAQRLGSDHHELLTSAVDHPELLDEVLWHLEEPIADLSSLGFLLLSRLARESVTVALSGQGADELLGGYRKHQVAAASGLVARAPGALATGLRAVAGLAPAGSTTQRGLMALGAPDPVERLLAMSRVLQAHERSSLLTREFMLGTAEEEIRAVVRAHLNGRERTVLGETLHLDAELALVDNMLLYFDKISMAASLEVRVPFMDHDVVGFCTALPDARRVWRLRRKELLKRASRGLVDDHIIDKQKRGFFHSALGAWLRVHREELLSQTLLDARARERGLYRPEAVAQLVTDAGDQGKKLGQSVMSLFLLERWHRIWVDNDGPGRRLADAAGGDLGRAAA